MSMTIDNLVVRVETLEKQLALLLKEKKTKKPKDEPSSDDEVVVEKKEKKDKKEKKEKKVKEVSSDDEDKPKKKRGANGYILFSKSVRDEVIAKLSVDGEKPKNTEIMKQQAAMWAEVDADEKAIWNAKAKEAVVDAE
jgi:catalase